MSNVMQRLSYTELTHERHAVFSHIKMKVVTVIVLILLDLSNCFAQSEGNLLIYNVHYNKCMTNFFERLSNCDPHAGSQQFRWISKDRILNTFTKKCLGVGSRTVGKTLQWLMCKDDNVLQKWECDGDSLLRLKNESLYLSINDNGVPLISKDTGIKSKWTIHGTQDSICSRPYEELYTIDGNAFGRPCHFPFQYEDKWYADCTKDGAQSQRLWCSVEADYSVNQRWGYCPTRDNTLWSKNPLTSVFYQLNDKSALTWHQARKSCHQQGAELLSVSEPHEHTFVSGMILKTQDSLWTGLNKLDVSSGWHWSNRQPLRYLKWLSGYPSTQPDHSCGSLKTLYGSQWINELCTEKHGYICQRGHSVPTVPPVVHTGFCQSPWIPYSGHCYLLHRNKKTWQEARDVCLREGGDLLGILNTEEQSFVITQLGYLKTDELWIGFNDRKTQMLFEWSDQSSVTFASWEVGEPSHNAVHAEDCVLMRGEEGKWADEICQHKYGFICKKKTSSTASNNDTVVTNPGCKAGWSRYGYYCYMVGSETKTFEEAKQMCEKSGSQLVDIASRVVNAFLVSLVGARPEKYFWTGLSNQKDRHTFEWTNTKQVPFTHFNAGMPGRKQGCVAMATGRLAGLWDVLSCSNKEKYICKQRAEGIVTTQAPPTTPSLECSNEWTPLASRDFCVKLFDVYASEMKTWSEALDFCRELGGDLLSLHHEGDIPWEQGGMHSAWIGYTIQDPSVGYVWSDGSSSSYQSWDAGEPNNLNNIENCVVMRISWWDHGGMWNDINCKDRSNWYCQIPKGKTPKEVNITEPVYNETDDGWIEFKGNQYFVSEYVYTSANEARIKCKNGHGDLAVINDEEERVFIWHRAKELLSDVFIGLTVELDGSYWWMDGSPIVFQAWEANQPSLLNSEERCVTMTVSQGLWKTVNCGEEFEFVCKRSKTPPVNATVAPTEEPKGGCAGGWKQFGTKCYMMSEDMKTWKKAREYCRSRGGDLVSVMNKQQQAYFTTMISDKTTDFWIGFSNLANGRFKWTDGSSVTYTSWARGEPQAYNWHAYWINDFSEDPKCAVIGRGVGSDFGKWVATDCNSTRGFICARDIDPEMTSVPFEFPKTFVKMGNSSLKVTEENRTWSEANRLCEADGAHLASIRTALTQAYAELQVFRTKQPVWIGLNSAQTDGYFSWVNNWPMNMENWAPGEPQPKHPCVYMDVTGEWKTALCNETFYSVCEQSTEISPTPPAQYPGQCPESADVNPLRWIPYKDSCYAFVKDSLPWSRASRFCLASGAYLVSIMDAAEDKFIENNLIVLGGYNSFWIGLFQTYNGHWLWSDGKVVDYTNWEPEENVNEDEEVEHFANIFGNPNCVFIHSKTKNWRKRHCDYSFQWFICKTAKIIHPTIKGQNTDTGPEPHKVYTGLAVFLAIAGFSVLGVLTYVYFYKKRLSFPTFENPMYSNTEADHSGSKDANALIDNIEIME